MSQVKVGWIGLGAMGSGMASSLVSQGYEVKAYDVYKPSLESVVQKGAKGFDTPAEAAQGVQVLGLMVVNATQVEDVLFGEGKVAEVLEQDSTIICFSTVPPSFLVSVAERLDALGKNIGLCDCPVSGGSTRAGSGELTIMTSGTPSSVQRAKQVLDALTRPPVGGLSVVGDKVGIASDFKLINQVFCAVQILSQGEVIALAKNWGMNVRLVYNVLKGASGDAFMFRHRVPWSLNHDGIPKSAMTIIAKDVGIVMDESRLLEFPLPMSSITEQVFTAGLGAGLVREDDGWISKLWERFGGQAIGEKGTVEEEERKAQELQITPSPATLEDYAKQSKNVLVVGLGIIGLPIAQTLAKNGVKVVGYDVNLENLDKFSATGGKVTSDVQSAAKDAESVFFVVNDAKQIQSVLFGSEGNPGVASVLPEKSTIIIASTISPNEASSLQAQLNALSKDIQIVDAPVSGGPSRASTGDLSIFASGSEAALSEAYWILSAISSSKTKDNLHFIPGGVGSGSKIKLLNNLLAAIHLAVAAEALNFAKFKKMDLQKVFEVVKNGAAWSYMMVDRVPRMMDPPSSPHATTSTILKDVNLVLSEAKKLNTPLFLGQAASQQFARAVAKGWGGEDDSSLGRLWEDMGVSLRQ
ncbi:uncharacterized protein I303_100640 [Kwoniella dejecticola CBS 10117]|uniref:3-hydroxyisobutyrate dehydrogenase n=1 Tax=Kwoniella dejecticola CBS 10117 TaxID=1296121 RepID=A0A1A6AFJ2_9TREE|nr:uncharacterized protein I303_00643 [Kwoniella dejecticola CBS 10117]OBR88826.1 hypothetical protein I303_00643 [Kwoniella dejecticola CBS 10117]